MKVRENSSNKVCKAKIDKHLNMTVVECLKIHIPTWSVNKDLG